MDGGGIEECVRVSSAGGAALAGAPHIRPVIMVHQTGVSVRSQTQATTGGRSRSRQIATRMRDAAYRAAKGQAGVRRTAVSAVKGETAGLKRSGCPRWPRRAGEGVTHARSRKDGTEAVNAKARV